MDARERDTVARRVAQIKVELKFPKVTASQADALLRELSILERKLYGVEILYAGK